MPHREILIVEDDGIIAAHLELSLRRMGYTVAGIAGSGEEALAMAAARRPGLVLMDIGLPGGMDGITAAARLREQHGISVVYLTAHTDDATLERAKATEPAGYLSKPFHEASLKATVTMMLHKGEAERALRESEEKFRLLSEQALVGMAIFQDDRITFGNQACADITGHSVEEMQAMSITDIASMVHPDDVSFALEMARRRATGAAATNRYSHRIVTKAGSVKWVERFSRMAQHGGRPAALLIFVDVTERKRAEGALAEKQRHYELLLQSSRDAVHVLDRSGKLREHNAAFLEHLGYTAEEASGLSVADWEAQWTGADFAARVASGPFEPARFETLHRRKDGSIREVEIECAPFEEGGEVYLHASARDVTDRRRAERELQEARDALASLNRDLEERVAARTAEVTVASRARDDFLSVMSHELRTPLNGVLGITECLREGVYGSI